MWQLARRSSSRAALVAAVVLLAGGPAEAQRFRSDDPLQADADNLTIPEPTERSLSKTIDLFQKTWFLTRMYAA